MKEGLRAANNLLIVTFKICIFFQNMYLFHIYLFAVYLYLGWDRHSWGGQKIICGSHFSSSTLWAPRISFRHADLSAIWAIAPDRETYLGGLYLYQLRIKTPSAGCFYIYMLSDIHRIKKKKEGKSKQLDGTSKARCFVTYIAFIFWYNV